ncbi:hypothetical protein [Novosphingobium huizhouense]|uniref:hypothetical protein n=1 Tax=Novosphingobium huizhouense TaxID=2866625 RepID=UPI001CD88D45|nr:hypothetical protein [Novosphingobium huizhouense]
MSDNPITNVLNILRLLKHNQMPNHNTYDNVRNWCGDQLTEGAVLRLFAYALDQCQMATEAIFYSSLSQEAKDGLLQTVQSLRSCFSPQSAQSSISSHLPQIDSSISSFAILASVYGDRGTTSSNKDVTELSEEVRSVYRNFSDADPQTILTEIAKRHLSVLLTTLDHVDAFGIDSAMAVYAELLVRLKTASQSSAPGEAEKTKAIWPSILKWGERLSKIAEAVGTGNKLLENGGDLAQTLIGFGS